jgi:Zn-dependent peptidase ImmA (M78 family)
MAAEKIQKILEVRERITATHERVDVFDALAWLDVRVIFKPLDGLLGAYIRGDQPGVMISTRRPLSVQRFTAAHELGHAVMDHEPSLDSPNVLRRAAYSQKAPKISGFASYLQEIEADAFAGTFLLPNWLITHHAQKHGWSRADLSREETVYQLALRCGASYQATVWALERNNIISLDARVQLLGVKPKQIKQRIGHVRAAAETKYDAWVLNEGDNSADIPINVGDTVTMLTELGSSVSTANDLIGAPSAKRIFYRADGPGAGRLPFEHRRPWEQRSIGEIAFNLSVTNPEHGLSRANRVRQRQNRHGVDVG